MSTPQLENGYTSIANELIEVFIRSNLSSQELRLILLVIRKTYGFHKKEDYISLSQMANTLNTSIVRCSQVINSLQQKNIITLKENIKGKTKKYKFNKDYSKWTHLRENLHLRKNERTLKEKRNLPLRKTLSTKETITKETITKESLAQQYYSSLGKYPYIQEVTFYDVWIGWMEVRHKLKVPNTDRALKLSLNKLHKHKIEISIQMLEHAIEKGWKGIYPLKESHLKQPTTQIKTFKQIDIKSEELKEPEKRSPEELKKVRELVQGLCNKIKT